MNRLGRNRDRYEGETIAIDEVLRDILAAGRRHGWTGRQLPTPGGAHLPVLHRPATGAEGMAPRMYLSAGIHGDEPAGPLAVRELIERDALPRDVEFRVLPCLNPTGFPRNTRVSSGGHDLNRDYRHRQTPEVRAHVEWLAAQPPFEVTFCLHEDWEAEGFYLYELNPENRPSLAPAMLDAARGVCPIDRSPRIDGREAHEGLIRPVLDPAQRPEWPEAFYLLQHQTRLSYTLEAPSDFAPEVRVAALTNAVEAGVRAYLSTRNARGRISANWA